MCGDARSRAVAARPWFSQPGFAKLRSGVDVLTTPGGALAHPTRARLFALVAQLRRPAATAELAERLGLHPNGVRLHLERLADAGLLERGRERLPRGRPRDTWSVSPEAQPAGEAPSAYADLGRWLVRALVAAKIGVRDVEAAGRRIGRDLAPAGGGEAPEERMRGVLAALGFQPEREQRGQGRLAYRLRNCPYREVVGERRQVVCGLHRGMTRGLLDEIDPATKLTGFVPEDPEVAGCLIELRGPMAGGGSGAAS